MEMLAVAVTVVAVWLTARQVIWCWPLSMVSVALYAWVFYEARLYAEVGLQALYFVLCAYGWWAWRPGGAGHRELRVTVATARMRWLLPAVAALAGLALGATLARFTVASLPFVDSLLAAFSVLAQWMQTRKLLEAWLVWIAVDVAYVGMFLAKDLVPTACLYAAFLVLAGIGFRDWRRSMAVP